MIPSSFNSFSDTLHACVGGWVTYRKLKLLSFLNNFLKDNLWRNPVSKKKKIISGFVGDEDQAEASYLAGCVLSF